MPRLKQGTKNIKHISKILINMNAIKSLKEMVSHLEKSGVNKKIAVAVAEDDNTIGALISASNAGFATPILMIL